MELKIGQTINIKGIDCFILDFIDNKNPFVIAFNAIRDTYFDEDDCPSYVDSSLKYQIDRWEKNLGIPIIPRSIDFTAMNGSTEYCDEEEIRAAPLTFDEARKYGFTLIRNHLIEGAIWTCTPWAGYESDEEGPLDHVCVYTEKEGIISREANWIYGVAPAFILDIDEYSKLETSSKVDLSSVPTSELLAEIAKRTVQRTLQ